MMPRLVLTPTRLEGRLDRGQDALADARAGVAMRRRRRLGAAHELGRGHAVAGGEGVHIAGLRGIELVEAGAPNAAAISLGRRRHAAAPRAARRPASAATRSSTNDGRDVDVVTFCRPDHAGMLLTSSTVGRRSRAVQNVDAGEVARRLPQRARTASSFKSRVERRRRSAGRRA